MANKGYCSEADIAAFLGRVLTSGQLAEATVIIGATESYIDHDTRMGWKIPPVTHERVDLYKKVIYLYYRPVASVQQVVMRTQYIADPPITLVAGTDYELFDPNLGQLNILPSWKSSRGVCWVDYTPALDTVPEEIRPAATLIAANTLAQSIIPDNLGLEQASFGRMTTFRFRVNGLDLNVPSMASDILSRWRRVLV